MKPNRKLQTAKEVMSSNIVFIDGMATAKEAVGLMRSKKVEALIVEKRYEQDAYGIVVLQDLINGVIIPDRPSEEVNIYEIMSKPAIAIPADLDIRYVASLFLKASLKVAPVEEKGEFIGMISLSTLILDNVLF